MKASSNKSLQSNKEKLEDDFEAQKDALTKYATQVKELTNKLDKSNKELTALKKESNQLKNEVNIQ